MAAFAVSWQSWVAGTETVSFHFALLLDSQQIAGMQLKFNSILSAVHTSAWRLGIFIIYFFTYQYIFSMSKQEEKNNNKQQQTTKPLTIVNLFLALYRYDFVYMSNSIF